MRNHQKLTLLFWHRKSKADAMGYAPVICRISIDGEEPEELAIGMKVHLNNWDLENKKAKAGGTHEKKTNLKISEITVDLNRDFQTLQNQYEIITPLMVKNVYKGLPAKLTKRSPKPEAKVVPSLLQATDVHVANFKKMVDKKLRSHFTLKQWNSTRAKIEEFLVNQYHLKDIDLGGLDYSFAVKFYNYLTIEREKILGEAAAKKQVKNLKEVLTFAETSNWIDKNPIIKFKCGGDDTDVSPTASISLRLVSSLFLSCLGFSCNFIWLILFLRLWGRRPLQMFNVM